jgi:ABC-2 type transport system ATP-binding protein
MEEAERLCDRVAIIDRGQIIALGTPRELIASIGGQHVVEFAIQSSADNREIEDQLWADLPGVTAVGHDRGRVQLAVTEPHIVIPAILELVAEQDLQLASLSTRNASLEDVFVKLTGRHLADTNADETLPEDDRLRPVSADVDASYGGLAE